MIKITFPREYVELVVLDNHYSSKAAILNVDTFIRKGVELVIEFQADETVAAPVISA